jgi:uncharacterized lipoprotein YajG
MKRILLTLSVLLALAALTGCAYFRAIHDFNNPYPIVSEDK